MGKWGVSHFTHYTTYVAPNHQTILFIKRGNQDTSIHARAHSVVYHLNYSTMFSTNLQPILAQISLPIIMCSLNCEIYSYSSCISRFTTHFLPLRTIKKFIYQSISLSTSTPHVIPTSITWSVFFV